MRLHGFFSAKETKNPKRINRGLIPAKETKNPKTDFSTYTVSNCFGVKTAYHMDFFSNPIPKKHKSRKS